MHDPFQTYSAFGAYPGVISPFQSPYTALQNPAVNPMVGLNPMAAFNPIAGIHPQQLQQVQLAQILAQRAALAQLLGASPFQTGPQNPLAGLQNPLAGAGFENPLLNPLSQFNPVLGQTPFPQQIYGLIPHTTPFGPQVGQPGVPYGQPGVPYGQPGVPYGQPGVPYGQPGVPYLQAGQGLAPQSWIGQPVINPLIAQQLAARGLHGQWAGCY
jgi:hypothetical protein